MEKVSGNDGEHTQGVTPARQAQQDDMDGPGLLWFVGSFYVEKDGVGEHGVCETLADSLEEAIGVIYMEMMATFQTRDGWSPPHIIMSPRPFHYEVGRDSPSFIMTDDVVGNDADSGSCGTCGSPDGPCVDPMECPLYAGGRPDY